ncbi:GIY-YIG nuclease family protein [Pseudoalteromonas sp. C8]|uniref:GIY-YIG nuclease family protein n=1 Tax=Pseudoalteromonas sp. C8 TaxID=2686345 RepID=UPI0013FD9A6B|nr:GIY-YIG nuclease family protein [Pseudoalteromonas sp. C8]
MDDMDFLNVVLSADKFGWISKPKPKNRAVRATDLDDFMEINDFYRDHGKLPSDEGDMVELKLFYKLEKIKEDKQLINKLKDHDEFSMLDIIEAPTVGIPKEEEFQSLDDIINSDLLEFISPKSEVSDILSIKNVTDPEIVKARNQAESIGKTTQCSNFLVFEPLFKNVHKELAAKTKLLGPIADTELSVFEFAEGNFYLLKGMLLFVDYMSEVFRGTDREDRRLLIVYENGTQSTMLLRSLTKRIREDNSARRILTTDGTPFNAKRIKGESELDPRLQVLKQTKATGYIYIARTLKPDLKETYKHLYKIGLTKRDVSTRFKEAAKDPAFLMHEAEQVKVIPLNGLNLNSVESAIHALFGRVRLNVEVTGNDGRLHKAKEWFNLPLETINDAVTLIQDNTIHMYRYDSEEQKLVRRV